MPADRAPQLDLPQPTVGRGSARPPGRIDIVAIIAGLLFIAFSVVSLTVGVLELPHLGAAPLWVFLIGGGVLLLLSELRGRKNDKGRAAQSAGSAEQAAWEQDPYR